MSLTKNNIKKHYEGLGKSINSEFLIPALKASITYDRLTSYFTVESFLSCAEGIDAIWEKKGKVRLLLGIHSVPRDLLIAKKGDPSVDRLIEIAKANVLEGVKSITDEMALNKIGVLAMMMAEGFLDIRVASPLDDSGRDSGGILHSKRFIFHDDESECVVAIGSPNETASALSKNFEEITVHASWQDREHVDFLVDSFERMWNDQREDLDVRVLDKEFASQLLTALGPLTPKTRHSKDSIKSLLEFMRKSPEFAFANIAKAALFPHQERALRDAVSRWPLRVLLADEVGLGKTIEAGSVIAYARRELQAKRVLILTPAGLRRQWQSELKTHFGIDASIYESDSATFLSSQGKTIRANKHRPLDTAPECIIVSWQLVRSSWMQREVFEEATWKPDLILIDEAHSARRNKGLDGRIKTTLVWEMVKRLSGMCPHLVLLTATPMQMQIEEYHGLLMLLGLPEWWNDSDTFIDFLSCLEGLKAYNELAPANLILEGVAKSIGMFDHLHPALSLIKPQIQDAMKNGQLSFMDKRTFANEGDLLRSIGINLIPPSALTVRNTRTGLESIGYRFPTRMFHSPSLDIDESIRRFLRRIDGYLNGTYGMVEQVLGHSKGGANAFIKSIYYQRLVSSLSSAGKTLERRADRLKGFIDSGVWNTDQGMVDQDDVDVLDIETDEEELSERNLMVAKQNARIEIQAIEGMLEDIDRALSLAGDAKMNVMRDILVASLAEGDAVLIFSRFKDTVDACIETMEGWLTETGYGYGCYTGQGAWIEVSGQRKEADKTLICDSLRNGDIKVVFCSDAASEGLNLQTARRLINVDVPWNPARLEQRIGRVARLGQKAQTVDIYNLWFPGTVESNMYTKLLGRQELYSLAVGEFPEVVGEVIRDRLKAEGSLDFGDIESTLNALRSKAEYSAIQRIWASPTEMRTMGATFRAYLFDILKEYGQRIGALNHADESRLELSIDGASFAVQLEPGDKDSISLYHSVLDAIERAELSKSEILEHLYLIESDAGPVSLLLEKDSRFQMLDPIGTLDVLRYLLLGDREPSGHGFLNLQSGDIEILSTIRKSFPFRIEPGELKIPTDAKIPVPKLEANYRIASFAN